MERVWMQSETETGVYFITKSRQLKCVARKCKLSVNQIITGDKRSPCPFGPSITRNLLTRVLTICHVKLTQSTALEQKRFDLRLLSPALRNLWLLGSLSNSVFERRTSTGSIRFASLGSGLVETLE